MKAIKALVLFMGLLIVIGFGVLVYGLMNNWGKTPAPKVPPQVAVPMPEAPRVVGILDLNLNQPQGSRIVGTSSSSGQLFVTIEGGGLAPRVVIVDLTSGRVTGTLRLDQ